MSRFSAPSPAPELTGHLDGYALRFGGEVVDVFPALDGAVAGRRAARAALVELDQVLARAPSRGAA